MKTKRIRTIIVSAMVFAAVIMPFTKTNNAYAGGLGMEHEVYMRLVELGAIEDTGNGYGYGAHQPRTCDYATTEEYIQATQAWWNWQEQMYVQALLDTGHEVEGYSCITK